MGKFVVGVKRGKKGLPASSQKKRQLCLGVTEEDFDRREGPRTQIGKGKEPA